jgi:hypothetical protein
VSEELGLSDDGNDTGVELGVSAGVETEEGSVTEGEGVGVGDADGSDDGSSEGEGAVEDSVGREFDGEGVETIRDDVLAVPLLLLDMATAAKRDVEWNNGAATGQLKSPGGYRSEMRDASQSRYLCQNRKRDGTRGGWRR